MTIEFGKDKLSVHELRHRLDMINSFLAWAKRLELRVHLSRNRRGVYVASIRWFKFADELDLLPAMGGPSYLVALYRLVNICNGQKHYIQRFGDGRQEYGVIPLFGR